MSFITPLDIVYSCLEYSEPAYLQEYLNHESIYQSDWFETKLIGKDAIVQHLRAKFSTLNTLKQARLIEIELIHTYVRHAVVVSTNIARRDAATRLGVPVGFLLFNAS